MECFIDMHCHILPGVDDGAANWVTTESMLQMAYNEGIRCIIATPHFHPRRGHANPDVLENKLTEVRRLAEKIDKEFRIYIGNEIYFGQDVPEQLKNGRILPINHRKQILVEFAPAESFPYIQQGVQQLQMAGYEVILAHVERYPCLVDAFERTEHLWNMGVNIQINGGSITGKAGFKTQRYVKRLMEEDKVFAVGTDSHDDKQRAPKIRAAAQYVKRKYGSEYAKKIFYSNAVTLLTNDN